MHVVAGKRLTRQLAQSADGAGCRVRFIGEASKPWSAAMFMGGLHEVTIAIDGENAQRWIDGLDEDAIRLPGFVLSTLEVTAAVTVNDQLTATIEAETVQEA